MSVVKKRRERIIALDILRGYFIIVIIINHLAWNTNLFEPVTGSGSLWASSAEGFFVVSGILVGYIYGPKILSQTKKTIGRLLRRALLLYGLIVGCTLLFTLLASTLDGASIPEGFLSGATIQEVVLGALTFNYVYGLTDFLSRYAIFMLIAPLVLWVIARFKYIGAVSIVITSVITWILLQPNVYTSSLANIAVWQIIFMPSIIIGYYLPAIERWFKTRTRATKQLLVTSLLIATTTTYILSYIHMSFNDGGLLFSLSEISPILSPFITTVVHLLQPIHDAIQPFTDKQSLGYARLLIGIVWFWTLYLFTRKYEKQIQKATRGFVSFFGENSLVAYVSHAFVIFTIELIVAKPAISTGDIGFKTVFSALTVAIVYVVTWIVILLLKRRVLSRP